MSDTNGEISNDKEDNSAIPRSQVPLSEVGSDGKPSSIPENAGLQSSSSASAPNLLSNMEALLTRILAAPQTPATAVSTPLSTQFIKFDPDERDADIEGWCRITEMIVVNKKLDGIELLMALTKALKGRAATCLTRLKPEQITWAHVKETLIAKFCKPKLMQDYFDDVLRFQIGSKETACEAATRLWDFIERIPTAVMSEEVIVGFVISVLCQKDNFIRRELNANVITTRPQLFRVLRGISLKRRSDTAEDYDTDAKRPRINETKFIGRCHWCGMTGHKQTECRKRIDSLKTSRPDTSVTTRTPENKTGQAITCFSCKKPGHLSNACPEKKGIPSAVKEVNTCGYRASRGTMETSIGEKVPFLFDSGSSCSLLKCSMVPKLTGALKNCYVYLTGIGKEDVLCTSQILSTVKILDLSVTLLFHIVADDCVTEPVIIGRDILDQGVHVSIDKNVMTFQSIRETVKVCEDSVFDMSQIDTDLTGKDKADLLAILEKYSDHFIDGTPSKRVTTGELEIKLIDPNRIVQRSPYRLSPSEKQVVREKIQELLDAGVIRESSSPFASPILLVKKKDNTYRMCVDYRELNANTHPEHFPLPRIDDQIDHLTGAHYFSSLDMASGFHQIPIHPDSIERTAFVTPESQYEYLAVPFGLRNAPSVYQRCINKALKDLEEKPLAYMDDVLCYSSSIEDGLRRLNAVLKALTEAGFSFNVRKCSFMKQEVNYLGYSIKDGEVRPNQRKIQALIDAPPPKTATQVRQFLGLASYFRRFIHNFSNLLGPIYPLTKLKGPIKWSDKHEEVRKTVIKVLTSEPVLTIFDPDLPVELHTDASSEGYGAILIQRRESLPHVVAYYSRRTTEVESRYHSYELETLAVVRAVEHFRHYLYGRHFVVFTDCNSLKASKSKTDLTPRVHRWWAFLQAFDFDIEYKPGRSMEHADYLSRNHSLSDVVQPGPSASLLNRVSKDVQFVELHQGWLAVEQKRDKEIQDVIVKYNTNEIPQSIAHTYDVREGVLYRKVIRNKVTSWLPIVPRSLIWTLINQVHTDIQHLGADKTVDKLYERFWFPEMTKRVRQFVDSCIVCKASKGPSGPSPVQLHPIPKTPIPWHTIHVDFSGKLSGKSDQKEYCHVIIDAFSKYVLLEHTLAVDAKSALKALKKAVCTFGAPKRIIADQGRCYSSAEFRDFCTEYKIELHFIATGASRANGQVERVMRTLKSLLTIVENDRNKTWRDELDNIQLALNSTKSRVTGYTATELLFGIRADSLGMSQLRTGREQEGRLDLDTIRVDASNKMIEAGASETHRFNRGKAKVKLFSKGDYVFLKSSERNQTKLDRRYRGPFLISAVLENDRYELKSMSGACRTYKYSHENLRAVPRGHEGLIEIASNLMDEDREVELENGQSPIDSHDGGVDMQPTQSNTSLTASPDTVSIGSNTFTAGSDTLSAYSGAISDTLTADNSDTASLCSNTFTAGSDTLSVYSDIRADENCDDEQDTRRSQNKDLPQD